jgi:hypothetical protein
MYLDFLNGTTDLVITMKLPRNLAKIKEERVKAGSMLGDIDDYQQEDWPSSPKTGAVNNPTDKEGEGGEDSDAGLLILSP